ncbi:MAG: glutamate N-acetyltransferase / amino-acid N-acetyltransferase [Candidatus Argoarchaeum ethanivorans]|uniref:Glutamate N-acetyltransferase n=1 Tax=Candidatus Argoarchaeum ethanivorans TaxID=2608793 RepID=A0A8B3S1B5_9EURY|nr:MAG: glutamate N-acetyltransferase / amino-acid N-acetyltransferase [Candidatus Argoarchaeum ethanivorans]
MKELNSGICAIEGISTWGIKEGKYGLAIIRADGFAVAVYTQNKVIAAPLIVTKKHLESQKGHIKAVIANSGNANACTGQKGIEDAEEMCKILAQKLNCKKEEILVASTGIIGRLLPVDKIKQQIDKVMPELASGSIASQKAAEAIITTDTTIKQFAVETVGYVHVGGIAKGAGMIAPNMATMLAFICTDACLPHDVLQDCLQKSVDKSFNMVIVDGDTSTNDMAILITTEKKECSVTEFQQALDITCINLARMMAKDGEGATKLIELTVTGAETPDDAKRIARTILTSPLVKTAIFGEDPNWGRIIAAAGRSGANMNQKKITLEFSDKNDSVTIIDGGKTIETTSKIKKIMKSDTINIQLDLNIGKATATGWGCDLTYEYVKINAKYST